MASIYRKRSTWYVGLCRRHRPAAHRRDHGEHQGRGPAPGRRAGAPGRAPAARARSPPDRDGGGTVGELLEWWLGRFVDGTPSKGGCRPMVIRHLIGSPLGAMTLAELTAPAIEELLQGKVGSLAPRSINHLRSYLGAAFNAAIREARWRAPIPWQRCAGARSPGAPATTCAPMRCRVSLRRCRRSIGRCLRWRSSRACGAASWSRCASRTSTSGPLDHSPAQRRAGHDQVGEAGGGADRRGARVVPRTGDP